jgi:hypothetical protein
VAGATNTVVLEKVVSVGNKYGVAVATGNDVVVSRSVLSDNSVARVEVDSEGEALVDNTEITHNMMAGVQANGTIVLGNSDITLNTTVITGATTWFGNNRIFRQCLSWHCTDGWRGFYRTRPAVSPRHSFREAPIGKASVLPEGASQHLGP